MLVVAIWALVFTALLSEASGFSFQLDLLLTGTWEAFKSPSIKIYTGYLKYTQVIYDRSLTQCYKYYYMMVSIGSNKNVKALIVSALKLSYQLFSSTSRTFPNLSQLFCHKRLQSCYYTCNNCYGQLVSKHGLIKQKDRIQLTAWPY